MRQQYRVTLYFKLINGFDIGGMNTPFLRRDDVFELFIQRSAISASTAGVNSRDGFGRDAGLALPQLFALISVFGVS